MANKKIYFLFLWLIIELGTPILSVSLYRNERNVSVANFNGETLKMLVGDQPKIQGEQIPGGMAIHLDTFRRRKRAITESENTTNIHAKPESVDDGICKRHEFQLNFAEIGWSWILHPAAVDIGVCRGSCNSKNALFITHNGNMRNLAYEKGLITKQEAPCCVPTKLRPVRIVYNDDTGTADFVPVPDMIVEKCGCK